MDGDSASLYRQVNSLMRKKKSEGKYLSDHRIYKCDELRKHFGGKKRFVVWPTLLVGRISASILLGLFIINNWKHNRLASS